MRSDTSNVVVSAGCSSMSARNTPPSRRSTVSSLDARTVAVRGVPSMSAVSPNAAPGPSTLSETSSPSSPSLSTRAVPSAIT